MPGLVTSWLVFCCIGLEMQIEDLGVNLGFWFILVCAVWGLLLAFVVVWLFIWLRFWFVVGFPTFWVLSAGVVWI